MGQISTIWYAEDLLVMKIGRQSYGSICVNADKSAHEEYKTFVLCVDNRFDGHLNR
jgi:hypothetical protein